MGSTCPPEREPQLTLQRHPAPYEAAYLGPGGRLR